MSNANTTYGTSEMNHAKIPLPKPQVHAQHPFKNAANHQKLLEYLQQRLQVGKEARDAELPRLVRIDKGVSGWMKLSDDDKDRQRKQDKSGIPLATQINLPLAYVHIDDMMTYFAQTFSPNRGMFYQMGKPDEVTPASQIVTLMNNHAIYGGFFREILLGLFSLLKYNSGGYHVHWDRELGPKIARDNEGNDRVQTELRWQGNRMEALDKYNLLVDPGVHPTKLHCDGEFVATAKLRTHYWLQEKAARGRYWNCEKALNEYTPSSSGATYYVNPPDEAQFSAAENTGKDTNWVNVLAGRASSSVTGFETVEIYCRLNPVEFGLITGTKAEQAARSRYEVWKFTILNDEYIIESQYQNNVHGYLPYFMGVLNDDSMGTSQKSTAEILAPLQTFASFLLNTHVQATRKRLWGLTVYDPSMVDLNTIPEGEVAARIAMRPEAQGRDVRTGLWEHSGSQDTNQTMGDLEGVMGIINQFFPTQSLPSQIASIDRAVSSQVAAVQQGANRRQQKAARLLDDSVFRNVRFAMYYNIVQFQPDQEQVSDLYSGKQITVNLEELRNTDLPFIIGQGLKAIDRQAAAESLQNIIFALIQAPKAAEGIDLLAMIDYWTSMIDIDVDMKTFRLAPPEAGAIDPATGQPAGNPISPATNPAALTTPIYG